jgi:membrane protein
MARAFLTALIDKLGRWRGVHLPQGKMVTRGKGRFRFECREAWDVLQEARRAFLRDRCLNLSAALAFYAILSLIPFLLLLISGTAYILGSSEFGIKMALSFSSQFFPHAGSLIFEEVGAISRRPEVFGLLGVFSMLWTASVIFSSLEHAMGVVFRVPQSRTFLKTRLLALSMVPASALFFLLSFSATSLSGSLREMETIIWGIELAQWSYLEFLTGYHFPYLVLTLGFTAVYKIIPNTPVSFHHALAGGASCAFLFELAKHSFAWYFKDYGRYGATCGVLDAMIILVLWTFFCTCILLFCAELISACRRRDATLSTGERTHNFGDLLSYPK